MSTTPEAADGVKLLWSFLLTLIPKVISSCADSMQQRLRSAGSVKH